MRLATRCPSCATLFLVVPDQLRVSDGWVRCGRCANVFNAAEDLLDVETGAPVQLDLSPPPLVKAPVPAPAPHWAADPQPDAGTATDHPLGGDDLPLDPDPSVQHDDDPLDAPLDDDWRRAPDRFDHPDQPEPAARPEPQAPAFTPAHTRRGRDFAGAHHDDLPEQLLRAPSTQDPAPAPNTTATPDRPARSAEPTSPWNMAPARPVAAPTPTPKPPPPPPPEDLAPGWLDDPAPNGGDRRVDEPAQVLADAAPAPAPAAEARDGWADSGLPSAQRDHGAPALDDVAPAARLDEAADSHRHRFDDSAAFHPGDRPADSPPPPWPEALGAPDGAAAATPGVEAEAAALASLPNPAHGSPAEAHAPSFLRQAERAARWQQSGWRTGLIGMALLLGGLMLAQMALFWRDTLAARVPASAPLLQAACAQLGCSLQPLRRIELLAVDSSGLKRVEEQPGPEGYRYRFNVLLHNRADTALMAPAMELTLSDTRGDVVIRRVLQMADFGAAPQAIPAGQELPLRLLLTTGDRRIEGYTVELFYP